MRPTNLTKIFFLLICEAALICASPAQLPANTAKCEASTDIPNLQARLASIENIVEQRRKDEHIPGLTLVIVAEDKPVYMHAFGLRNVEQNLAATVDTLFEIGSTTKAFTAMAAMISVDEGKLRLEDSPKQYLPYFKLRDPEADSAVTIRDLLSHRTGLPEHDDDVWLENSKLSREAVIRKAMMAKPTAKFREKFQYNNVMYSAAGECVAKAQNSTWETVIRSKIFEPLAMTHSAPSLAELRDASNFSEGYKAGNTPKLIKRRDLSNVAPAGAILSNVRDMAQWLRLMLNGGVIDGKRLVSETAFREIVTRQISVRDKADYGLGWGLVQWHDHKLILHTGGTDGFSSQVEFMPEQRLGFVLLCNVPEAKLVKEFRTIIWGALLDIH